MRNRIEVAAFLLVMVAACTGKSGLGVVVTSEPPGANCVAGGVKVQVGDAAPTYVCSGVTGADGQSAVVTSEPAGANCAAGGVKVRVGSGAPTYVCNGAAGADGQSVALSIEASGSNCATGGVKVQVGAGTPTYVCNGATGAAGQSVTVSAEPAGASCASGGVKLQVGSGAPTYVCNGATGAAGQSVVAAAEPPGPNCAAGGIKVQVGSGDPTYVCNGASGADGSSCSIVADGGDTVLTCTDGTSTILKSTYSVGGTVSGLLSGGLVIGMDSTTYALYMAIDGDGPYAFSGFNDGDWYSLWVESTPPTLTCSISNESDTIYSESVSWVDVVCACQDGLANCDGNPANGCETILASDNTHCGACGNGCTGTTVCDAGTCREPVTSFMVGDGPAWYPWPPAYSCVDACAVVFGGSASSWSCSTDPTTVNHLGWYSGVGDGSHCGLGGTPLAEDYTTGPTYETSFSAYVSDWCGGSDSTNYCVPNGP